MSGVEIRVRANSQQARSELKKVEESVGNIEKATRSLATAIKGAIATYSGFVTIKGIVQAADTFKLLENRLKLVAQAGEPVAATMLKLNRLAIASRTDINTTATNYQRLARSFAGTNRTSGEFLEITEAINKATKIGGQPLATQQAALFQLSQAFASGVLRGEEFNSVSEGAPEILKALTDSLNVSRAELREMAFDGQITSEILADSLLKQLPKIREEFDLLAPTVQELTGIMQGEFQRALSEIDKVFDFSGSTANKIQLLTSAFTFIADRAVIEFSKLKIILYRFQYDAAFVMADAKKAFLSLFDINFDTEAFKEKINDVFEGLKGLSFVENLPKIDLTKAIEGTAYVLNTLETWKNSIVLVFKNLYNAIIGNSWWREIFDEGQYAIGSEYYMELLNRVLGDVKSWGTKFVAAFKDIFFGYEEFNMFKEAGRESKRSGGIVSFFSSATQAIKDFTTALKDSITQSQTFESSTNFFTGKKDAFRETIDAFTTELSENGGILGYLTKVSKRISEISNQLGGNFKTSFDNFILGSPVDDPYAEAGRGSRREGGVSGVLSGVAEFADSNKWLLVGSAIAGAVTFALPAELRNSAIQGALFGLGYVIAAGFLSIITAPITLGIAAIALLPQALNYLTDQGLFGITTKDIGRAIADGIVNFFKDDAEGEGFGTRLINAIINAAGEFGAGLAEGFEIETEPLTDKIAGAFALAVAGTATVGILKNGLIGSAAFMVKTILKGIGTRFTVGALGNKLTDTLDDIKDDKKIKRKGEAIGKALGVAMIRGLVTGLTVATAADILSNITESVISDSASDIEKSLILGSIEGAGVGAAVGLLFGPLGALGGAIVGGILGSIVAAFTQALPAIKEWAIDVGTYLKDGLMSGWEAVKTSISDFFSNLNPFGDSGTASGDEIGRTSSGNRVGSTAAENSLFRRFTNWLDSTGFASGGYISGAGGPRDDKIPAMLSNGEFVIQASMVKKFGAGFFASLNSGMIPPKFAGGTAQLSEWQKVKLAGLRADEQIFLQTIEEAKQKFEYEKQTGNNTGISAAVKMRDAAQQGLEAVYAQIAALLDTGTITTAGGETITPPGADEGDSLGKQTADNFAAEFQRGFSEALRTGNFKEFGEMLVDRFTMSVIDSFSTGVSDALFEGLTGEGGPLTKLFNDIFDFGKTLGGGTTEALENGAKQGAAEETPKMFESISSVLKSIWKGISELFSSVFQGGFGGGGGGFSLGGMFGGIGNIFSGFGELPIFDGLFGGAGLGLSFNQGGIVPNTPYSTAGVDSVPAMLTPGELVVPADKVKDFGKENKGSQQTFNINVSGDVSRQTRKEIVKMLPEITSGVNMVNKENNFRR